MPAEAKVGSWLDKNPANGIKTEVYESSDEDVSSDEEDGDDKPPTKAAAKRVERAVEEDNEEPDDEGPSTPPEDIDWETLIPTLRPSLMDPSKKRRSDFISHYLTVTSDSPPSAQIPAVIQTLLQCLPLLPSMESIDDVVKVLTDLVERDESLDDAKLKLGDKLVKWVSMEVEKATSTSKTVTPGTYLPYLTLIMALLSTFRATRTPEDQLASSKEFNDLLVSLAYLIDAIETRDPKGKKSAKTERVRHKACIRLWRGLRTFRSVLPNILHTLLTKAVPSPVRLTVLIGHVVNVLMRLKRPANKPEQRTGQQIVEAERDNIITFYTTHILGAKTSVPAHVSKAFGPILPSVSTMDLLKDKLIPVAERMLLRSPETALDLTADMLLACPFDISTLLPAKLLPSVLASSKSSNAETRAKAVNLLSIISARVSDESVRQKMVTEILSLPKTGKTSSPDHRTCLFTMIGVLSPIDSVSTTVLDTLSPLIGKEGNEPALTALCASLVPHLSYMLESDIAINATTLSTLSKELSTGKIATRRSLSAAIGDAIWSTPSATPAMEAFVKAITSALETNLQTAMGNLPANPAGFLEGYVSIALALGPLQKAASASKLVATASTQNIAIVSPKPSFMLNERAYSKLPSGVDEQWYLRALKGLLSQYTEKAPKEEIRIAIGLAVLHLVFEAKEASTRQEALALITELSSQQSVVVPQIIRESLAVWLQTQSQKRNSSPVSAVDEVDKTASHVQKIGQLLSAMFPSGTKIPSASLAIRAVDFLVLTHHPDITENAQVSWIGLIQGAGLDPATVAADHHERILKTVFDAASSTKDPKFAEAAYRSITTLTFVSPTIYVDAFLRRIREDLDPLNIDFIGLEERGIWATPEDQVFVDVLSKKKDLPENKNRKDYATDKWEQEVRAAIAAKKASNGITNLSKGDKALVNAQMAKEAETRKRIATLQVNLRRGVELVSALIASNAESVERHLRDLAEVLLRSVFGAGSFLVNKRAFNVFLSLGTLASPKLGETRRMLAAAVLRSYEAPLIPDDYLDEPIGELVTRLLHQIHFIAAQTPLDSTSYALVSMLLSRVVELGGVGAGSPQSEEAQEQLTLAVNIIEACCGEFQHDAYPRLETIRDLIRIIANHSRLAKDATSALIDLGAAIKDAPRPAEVAEFIAGTLSKDSNVRNAVLQAIQPVDITDLDYSEELWIAMHDEDEQNANLASHVWDDNGLDIPETYLASLLNYLAHDSPAVRMSTAAALADAAEHYPSQIRPTISGLQDLYTEKAKILMPEYDRFGMVIAETLNRTDPYESRIAIASALEKMAPLLPEELVSPIFDFLISKEALGDRNGEARRRMLNAGIAIIDQHGDKVIADLMKMFEDYLGKVAPSSETADYIQEAVIILFGRLAGHLDSQDPRIPKVVDRLVDALNTPSELVQSAVADCLPPLVQGMGEEVEYLVDKLFSTLTTGAKYASRRGAAYGIAGIVKGRGLGLLKEFDLLDKLKEAAEDKASYQSRQGAVFAFETLSATLGKVFEPYIISIVPTLLTLFGDGNTDVREATSDAAKVIMSKISGHCVKLMLPNLLDALEEKQWRTKKGSIELLGSMAFCAPRQLSLSLPTIIPQLTGVINDSHAQVKSAANTSLKRFGEVLSNPEIKGIQSTLMKALADPTAKTNNALAVLLKTTFEHYLDAPSLALVMPIIDRGLRQRSSETKRKSVQIVGNMASLTESRDLVPYLQELMPLVHEVLVDPVPEARATAAKSLGTLVERLGENNFPDLVNQLLTTLKSDTSGVDRQGAAQGLSEVLSGLGMERLENMLPDIISSTGSPRPYVREGFISLLVYLPATFGHRFAPHLARVIPPILNGLADNSEFVREASMRAGKMIIANYSNKAVDLLLPELEKGMLDGSWRIRQSSISLTGELLYRVTGISGKVELEEEETVQVAENARKALLEALGQERRDRVLATLYIVRQDAVGIVRQASIHIWKALVQNTPRTTREILPILMQLLMSLLGSDEVEQQETASRTIGELCRKNGERIFGEIVPILQKAISSQDARTREGACLAFADVLAASNKDVMHDYEDAIISAIRNALVDNDPTVRSAAARTFDTMQHYMGAKAVDQTIPTLLEAMRNPGEASETALQALQEVMSVRANSVFPVLIPTLIAQPISAFNARALGALVKVAGSALNRRLDTVLSALVKSLETEKDEDIVTELNLAIESLLASVVDDDGIHQLEMLLMGWAKDVNSTRRATACSVFGTLCQVNTADTADYRVDWVRILISMFDDPVEEVVAAAWEALDYFIKTVDKDELEDLVVPLRRAIESCGAPGRTVPGFSRPKGVQSLVPILLAGVLGGTQEQREQAALGIGELVQRTSEAAIKPYIIQLTGPLIRVISGQSIAPQIKTAILSTLTVLLEEVPQLVKPFHPQLTRTFVKSASDPAALSVRNRAAAGLGALMKHQARVDPLITELLGGVRSADTEIASSLVIALAAVCASTSKNIGQAAKGSIIELVEEAFVAGKGETYNNAIAKVVAGLAQNNAEDIRPIAETFLAAQTPPTPLVSIIILAVLEDAPDAFYDLDVVEDIVAKVRASIGTDHSGTSRPAREAKELMRKIHRYEEDPIVQAGLR